MKMIKKYWAIIVGIVAALFALMWITKTSSAKKQSVLNKKIKSNEKQVEVLDGKVEAIEEQRVEVKAEIVEEKEIIADLKQQKETIKPAERPTADAKQNILNKSARNKKKK
jgi:predicted RNase H-like nuclease (RuvC/YqgF family)